MNSLKQSCVALLGVPVDNVTMDGVVSEIESNIADGGFHQIATANADFLVTSIRDAELKEILSECSMVIPDGMPLVWASRLMGVPLHSRVSGADLVPRLAALSSEKGYSIFLLGSSESSSRDASKWMQQNHPNCRIVGRYSPPYRPLRAMDHEDILTRIEAAKPDILLVAFGSPKQEKWMYLHRHRLQVPVGIGIGGSLDLMAGSLRRAPVWMQNNGLEWLYRMVQEPGRLAKRYFNNAIGLIRYMTLQILATGNQGNRTVPVAIAQESVGASTIFRISGSLTGAPVSQVYIDAHRALEAGNHVILDFSNTSYLGPDALGALLRLALAAKRLRRELWLTGLRPSVNRAVRASRLDTSFRQAATIADALRMVPQPDVQLEYRVGKDFADPQTNRQVDTVSD